LVLELASFARRAQFGASGCGGLDFYKLLEFEQDLLLVLRQIAHHPRIAEKLSA
jgi:hypothetical protein